MYMALWWQPRRRARSRQSHPLDIPFEIGSIDAHDILFAWQVVRRKGGIITVSHELAVEAVHEVALATGMKDSQLASPELHTE